MKIGIISVIHEPWGGSEELWASLARTALARGHQVSFCTYHFSKNAPAVEKLREAGLLLLPRRAYVPGSANGLRRKLSKIKHFFLDRVSSPYQSFFNWKPDLVLYNGTSLSIADDPHLSEQWNRFTGTRCILAHFIPEHNAIMDYGVRAGVRHFFQNANKLFFVSSRTALVTERTLAAKFKSYNILRNPVNLSDTTIIPFPESGEKMIFAMVGNLLAVHKGQDIMFQVLAGEKWKQRDWHLNIYGDGMDRKYLVELAEILGIQNRITFKGRVSDIREVWKQNQVLLMPSVMEGMPLAVVEAMLCGRPVLVTDVGGCSEWVTDGQTGFIAEAAGLSPIYEAMEKLWAATYKWEEMGKAAHTKAMSLFDQQAGHTFLDYLEN